MVDELFRKLLLIARPAAGKSEIINYWQNLPQEQRANRFHVGKMVEIDDFPMLWAWFEEDHILEEMGYPRLHTDAEGYFKEDYLWDVLIRRMNLAYQKAVRENPGLHEEATVILEFARGVEHGGFQRAFEHLSQQVLDRLAVLYIDVSWEESLRKNQARYNPKRPGSILEHSLPEEKMRRLYRESDWDDIEKKQGRILIQGQPIPFAVFDNQDDFTSQGGAILGQALETTTDLLWRRYQNEYSAGGS